MTWRERPTLRIAEVAELTGLSRSAVKRLVAKGTLASVRIENAVLVRTSGVLALLGEEAQTRGDAAELVPDLADGSDELERRLDVLEAKISAKH